MKKLFTLITSVLLSFSIYAQWTSFPGTASDISCASNTDLVCINNYPSSSLRGIYKYNASNGVWEVMTSGGDFTNASIASDGTIWGRSALNFGANSNLIKFNTVPAVSLNYTAVAGLLDNISASSSSAAIGSVTSQLNNIYRTTTTANTFSLLPLSAAFSAKKVVYASNGDLACINWASSGNNVFKYTTGTGWSSVSTSLPIFATDIAIGQNNQFQMAIVSGGNLYVRYNNEWLLDQTAPPNITKVTVAPNGRVFILTNATSNNIYNRFYDNIICANILTPPTNLTPTANLTVCSGATSTLVSSAAGSNTYWYDVPFGQTQNPIGSGTSFTTPPITQTTTYYVGYYSGGCYSPLTPITVNVPANNAGTLAGNQSICVGLTSTFTSTISGGTWSTSNGSIATVNASGLVTAIGPGTATVTYTIIGSGSCPSTSTRTITVLPAANAGTLSGNQTICSGSSVFSSTVSGGTWSSSNTSVATVNPSTGIVTGVSQGTAVITYSVSNTCGTATATRTVSINTNIGAVSLLGALVCSGSTGTFTSSPSGGVWSSSNTSVATIDANGVATGVSVGQTTISYSFQGVGCPSVSQVLNVTAGTNAGTLSGTQDICISSTTTFSSTVSGGTWSSSNNSIATVNTSGLVTGISAGTATITYTVAGSGSCSNGTATRTVTVSNGPAAPVNTSSAANLSKCAGSTATLTATGSGTISWYSDAAATNLITTGTSYTTPILNATTNYYLRINGSSCPSSITTITVTVNPLPTQPVNTTPTASLNICSGNSTTLTATTSANAVVTWYSSTGSVLGTGPSYTTGVLSNNTSIVARAEISGSPCVSAFTGININVTPASVAGTLSGTQAICAGSTTNFSSTVSGGSWSSSNNAIASVNASGVVTGVGAGTATITYTVAGVGTCPSASATRTVTVTAAPNAGTLSGVQAICLPGSTTFSTTASGGTWSSSNNAIATLNASGVVTGVAAGTATITYTVAGTGGCANATATRTVEVFSTITAGTLSGTQAICAGSTTNFSSTISGGSWSSSNNAIAAVNASGVVTGIGAGTATITYTIAGVGACPSASATRTVTVTAAPNAGTLSGAQAICLPGTTTFSTSGSGGTWSSSNNAIATVNASGVVTGVSVGTAIITYTVVGTGACANATATRSVTVENATTPAVISGDNSVCLGVLGSTLSLSSSSTSGTWSSSNNGIATVNQSGSVSGVAAGNVNIVYTIPANGSCAAISTTYPITINSASPTTILNETICFGETFILNGLPYPNQGTFGQNFPNSNGCDSLITLNLTILPAYSFSSTVQLCLGESYDFFGQNVTSDGIYTEVLSAVSGCDSTVTLNLSFVSEITSNLNVSICEGTSYTFGTQTIEFAGIYTETFVSAGGCDSVVTLNVNLLNAPSGLVVSQNEATLSANEDYDSYFWFNEANPLTVLGTGSSFTETESGNYYVAVYNADGCSSLSDVYPVVVSSIRNVESLVISLYPNPANTLVNIANVPLGSELAVEDVTGKVLFETKVANEMETLDVQDFANGIYFVNVFKNGRFMGSTKLVVSK